VVSGLNVIVFIAIAVLAHKEKEQKKRNGELRHSLDSSSPDANDGIEKKVPLVDEEDVAPELKL